MANAPAERGAGQLVTGPKRFPRRQELAALRPEFRPSGIVGHLRGPQRDMLGLDDRPKVARGGCSQQGHGLRHPSQAALVAGTVNFSATRLNLATLRMGPTVARLTGAPSMRAINACKSDASTLSTFSISS